MSPSRYPSSTLGRRKPRNVFGFTALSCCLLIAVQAAAVDFRPVDPLGIEYKTEVKVNATAFIKVGNLPRANYNFLEAVVTINNLQNVKKNLFICVSGYSRNYDNPVTRTELDMTFDSKTKVLGCMLSQNQHMTPKRTGQMGCRPATLDANQQGLVVKFVSGNHRTTISKVNMKLVINQRGPVQDGLRDEGKIIAAGAAGAGGHPLISPNTIGGKRPRMTAAINSFRTRFMLSNDAAVKLDVAPDVFNCNKCFGMGSTLGDPAATRTDFVLNLPSDDIKKQAQLTVQNKFDVLSEILLAAGGKVDLPFDLINETGDTAFVRVMPTFVELPSACTVQLLLPEPEPISLPPFGSKPASLEFDCSASLPVGASADVVLSMTRDGSTEVLGDYWIKARNSGLCDVNSDGSVDIDDIELIMSYRNTPAVGGDDALDINDDATINVLDARACTLRCTNPGCAR